MPASHMPELASRLVNDGLLWPTWAPNSKELGIAMICPVPVAVFWAAQDLLLDEL